ncbi:GerAB/ArcD/ProY family transporter [Bacillus sp. SD088]|uniref:GerAB/ArcD/ProY family transporter n=1 Tax=Bacillus sp. SD088 TaxID=2782012 RepID=UPI001A971C66|nr:GerAB/ArcD/ProY family transporter [Bacillus sp. SD088]MBO0993910.1 GerAB/ArcD/ProY family transporter [Bacillus sp. SD088]
MNRYYYYLIFVNLVANMISTVPRIFFIHKTSGTLSSLLLAIPVGLVSVYLFIGFFNFFQGKDLSELLKKYFSKWFYLPVLSLLAINWFAAGLITLINFTFMIKRFLTPDMSLLFIASLFLIFISYGVLMKTKSVLYTIETVLIFSIPLITFIFIKAYSSPNFIWDFVKVAVMYSNHWPSYSSFSAALYCFLGIANLIVFNRAFPKIKFQLSWKSMLFIGIVGGIIVISSYILPIGLNGFEKIENLVYPAITTSDTLRMKFGVIERVLFLFFMFFLALTFISLLIHWHVAVELCKNILWLENFKWKKTNLTPFIIIGIFWAVTLFLTFYLNEYTLLVYTNYFFNCLPPFFLLTFILFWFIRRRAKAA